MSSAEETHIGLRDLLPQDLTRAQQVVIAGWTLVGLSLALRAWAVYGAWFYSDDFIFLREANQHPLTLHFLFTPHDSHLMPFGVLVTWLVAHAGPFNWFAAASGTLLLQAVASASCLVMLRCLFGPRTAILLPLALYLFSTMTIDSFVWWAASLNALPVQIAFFLTVAAMVTFIRTDDWPWAYAIVGALAIGLISDPRGVQVLVPTAIMAMLFFTEGPLWRRPWRAFRRRWVLWIALAAMGGGYLALYARLTPSPVTSNQKVDLLGTARTMIGTSWTTALTGGPWHWDGRNPPMGSVDPPQALHVIAVAALIGAVAWATWRSARTTATAAVMVIVPLIISYLGLAYGRSVQIGNFAGLLMRFLADALPVATLAMGLALLPMAGATLVPPSRTERRRSPAVKAWLRRFGVAAGVAFIVGCLVSTVSFVHPWHTDFPARRFVDNARSSLARDPAVIADVPVPELVQSPLAYPENLPSHLLAPARRVVHTAHAGNDLRILDDKGDSSQMAIRRTTESAPGPTRNCGYKVADHPVTLRFIESDINFAWWISISYLASGDGILDLIADGEQIASVDTQGGIHTYFLRGEGAFSSLTFTNRTAGLTVCVDKIDVGDPVPLP